MTRRTWMRMSILKAALALFVTLLAAGQAEAGANETPGRNFRPHAFAYFSANQWEFGATDVAIFQKYVVTSQHYTQGAAYVDAANDLNTGGAGVWNFFTFCTDRAHDVMLVTSHGVKTPATCIAQYRRSAAGRAARDSSLAYWNGIFAAGSFVAGNYTTCYTINATQTFYTTYFMTPQALCWWATCWSSLLSMTGAAEARDYLGYDNSVTTGKCNCDQETVLNKMDGQQGQALRPLTAALAGINGICPPGGANLVHQGAGNTVLSPSVIENVPVGIVCEPTPGHVKFDCTMDVTVAPAAVIQAFGGGILVNHQWAGDDQVTYDVIPIVPFPTIFYDVFESMARSKADRARLDGNTNPAVNARGPNQDDFVWITTCPYWPYWPVTVPDPVCVPDPSPGLPVDVFTPVVNNTDYAMVLNAHLDVPGIPLEITDQTLSLQGHGAEMLSWPVVIPAGAQEGQTYPLNLTIVGPDGPQSYPGQIVVGGRLRAELVRPVILGPGLMNPVEVTVENTSGEALVLSQAALMNDQGWPVSGPVDIALGSGEVKTVAYQVHVPPATPPGTAAAFTIQGMIGPDLMTTLSLGSASTGLPVTVTRRGQIDLVPGNSNATIPIELVSLSLVSVNPIYQATDSHGYPVTVQAPAALPPGIPVSGTITFPIPADPTLIGTGGVIHLIVRDEQGNSAESDFSYLIEPAIEVITEPQSLYTGFGSLQSFVWPVTLRNRADVSQSGFVMLGAGPYGISPSGANFAVPPNGTYNVNARILLPPDAPVGLFQGTVRTQTSSGIGTTERTVEHEVTTPVVVDAVARASSGFGGETLELAFALWNRRADRAMTGSFQTTDVQGWTLSPVEGTYLLAPGQRDTVHVNLLLPASADTDSVAMTVRMTYDTGLEASMDAGIDVIVLPEITQVPDPRESGALESAGLESAYPNPFGASTQIRFHLIRSEAVRLTVHDVQGRRIATLTDGILAAGPQAVQWDGDSEERREMPDGIYFLRLETAEGQWVRKVVRMKR